MEEEQIKEAHRQIGKKNNMKIRKLEAYFRSGVYAAFDGNRRSHGGSCGRDNRGCEGDDEAIQ